MSTGALQRVTWEEYLAREREAETKSEFYDGEVFAMAGGTRRHSVIATNVSAELRDALRDRPCETYNSDMRVRCPNGLGTYPDVSVACEPMFEDTREDTLLNPSVIVEVLSPSTEAWDRGAKFKAYRGLASLREYLLVSQDERLVEQYVRQSEFDRWLLTTCSESGESIQLPTLDVTLALDDIYARIDFAEVDAEDGAAE